ncbi:MAG: hypothetical protein Q9220_006118 [cf. Caloplaca sp. 1 TL-2023]
MQTYHIRAIPRACRPLTTITAPQPARAMGAFFPHFPSQSFAPFFREIDSLFSSPESLTIRPSQNGSFTPRFDVREVGSAYELHGELPGIRQKDIDIEFVDANTLVIKGKTERSSTRGNESADIKGKGIEGDASSPKAVAADDASETSSTYQKATVEDEYVDAGAEREQSSATEGGAPTPTASEVAKTTPAQEETQQPQHKYWVSERSVGEFQRTFSFPGKVDQEAVKASLKNGILNVLVPKAAKQERKILIE